MLSRVADSLYWLARYMERVENIARFVDVNLHLTLDLPGGVVAQWDPLVTITGDHESFSERYGAATEENVIQFLTFDPDYANSIYCCVRDARENARSIREVISSEMWEQVNQFHLFLKDSAGRSMAGDEPHEFFTEVKEYCQLFLGLTETTMSHGEGWHFARLGRVIERADKTSRLLDVKYFILLPRVEYVGTPYDNIQWMAVLKSASAFEMYRKKYQRINPHHVAEFLIFDLEFPRAMRYCLVKAEESLHAITGNPWGTANNAAERSLGRLRAELDYSNIKEVIDSGMHGYLDSFQAKLNSVGGAVFETFFALPPLTPGV